MTFAELQAAVYTELKEGSVTSPPENYPLDMVKSLINEGYQHAFSQARLDPYLREKFDSFTSVADTKVNGTAVSSGDNTVNVASTDGYPNTGTILLDWSDIITYTGKTATSFTGCSGVDQDHVVGTLVMPMYDLPSDIEDQRVRWLRESKDERPYDYLEYDKMINARRTTYNYTILEGKLLLPEATGVRKFIQSYIQEASELTGNSDIPSLLPEQFHQMLVFYATGRALRQEEDSRGLIYFNADTRNPRGQLGTGLYYEWLNRLYARFTKRTATKPKRPRYLRYGY